MRPQETTPAPQPQAATPARDATPVLEVRDLKMHFPVKQGVLRRTKAFVYAVDGVSFNIWPGETLGLVGESGCGKSTVGRLITRLYEPTAGHILFEGQDLAHLKGKALVEARKQIQIIFQDPYASLNPRFRVQEIVGEAYRVHNPGADWRAKARELMHKVGLDAHHLPRYPHEFSGGQRQRIGIARALALEPRLIVADEPVSALDVSIQAQVINLLDSIKAEFGFSFLFVAHDLSVVEHIADRIAVMYLGKIVEIGTDRGLYTEPLHPYTQALLAAVPKPVAGARRKRRNILRGDVPNPINPPSGCAFHTRCPQVMDHCRTHTPALAEVQPGHWTACFLYEASHRPQGAADER